MIVPLLVAQLVAACAPRVGRLTMSAVVMYESGSRPFAIGDNSARRADYPADRAAAEDVATRLLRAGHNIDVGYAQLNSTNFAALDLDVHRAFEPCTNVASGAHVLERAYLAAARRYGAGQPALTHALSAYNTGGEVAGSGYAARVYETAAELRSAAVPPGAGAERRAVPFVPYGKRRGPS